MKLTFYGQSCFQIETAGNLLVFNPFITSNDVAKHIKIDRVNADYISISKEHSDHIARSIKIDQPKLKKAFGDAGVNLYLPQIDESIEF